MFHFVQQNTSFVQKVMQNCMSFCATTDNHKKRHFNIVKLNSRVKVCCSINKKPSCAQSRQEMHLKQHYKDYDLCNQCYIQQRQNIQTESIDLDSKEAKTMDVAQNQLCSDEYKMVCDDTQQTGDVVAVLRGTSDRLVELHETVLKYFQHRVDMDMQLILWLVINDY